MSNTSNTLFDQKRAMLMIVVALVIGFAVGMQFGGTQSSADASMAPVANPAMDQDYPAIADQPGRE